MNHFLKLAYNHGAQQALADLEKLATPNPYKAMRRLSRYNLPDLARFSPVTHLSEDFTKGGLTGMGYAGDLGLAAAMSMGAFNAVDD